MKRWIALGVALLALSTHIASPAAADSPQGMSPRTIKLPNGPASIKGLGESFAPNPFTGTGSFSIPIEVPPAQLSPQLSVGYAAGSGKGLLGLSFDLPFLKIIRTTAKGAPKFDENDRFAVMGPGLNDELVRVAADVPRYRLKNESAYALFERDAAKDQWVVRLPGNQVMYLGASAGSREQTKGRTYAWLIEKHVDAFQHEVRYTYDVEQGKRRPSRIDYQGHALADGYKNRVEFFYELRPDPFTDYSYGGPIRTTHRLTKIVASQGPRTMRSYVFGYESSELHSLLSSVRMFGEGALEAPGTLAMPTLRLGYVRQGEVDAHYGTMSGSVPTAQLVSGTAILEDVNADGLPDLLIGERARYRYYENIDGRRFSATETTLAISPDCSLGGPETLVADVDGDGFRDVICGTGTALTYYAGGNIRYSDGTFLGYAAGQPLSGLGALPALTSPTVKVIDLNKDGRVDFLYENNGSPAAIINQGNRQFAWSPDVLSLPTEIALSSANATLMDWNGDGELDFVRNEVGSGLGSARIWYGTGGGQFVWGQEVQGPKGRAEWFDWSDVNRDGQTDLIKHTGASVSYFLNNGDGALRESQIAVDDAPASYDIRKRLSADMNGNGTTDIVWVTADLQLKYLDLFGAASTYLLSRIENGLGQVTEIAYGSSTDFVVAAKLRGERWKTPLPNPVPVITEIYTTDSFDLLGLTPNETRVLYSYDHGYYDGLEREFRGFGRVITTDPGDQYAESRITETWHHVGRNLTTGADEESLKGKAYLTYVTNDLGELFSTSRTRWERRWLCGEDLPSGFLRVLPACGVAATRDERKDSLVATAVSTDTIDAQWEKGILRSAVDGVQAPAFPPALTGGHTEYDKWGRTIASFQYGKIAIDGYRPQQDVVCSAACAVGGGERDESVSYVEYFDIADATRWLPGMVACQASAGLLANGNAAPSALVSAACDAASPTAGGFTALSGTYPLLSFARSYYDDQALRQANVGLATKSEVWLADRTTAPGTWLTVGRTTFNGHGLPIDSYDARGDRRHVDYDPETALFPILETFAIVPDGQSGATSLSFTATYDRGFGTVTKASNPNGQETTYRYDGLGRLTAVLDKGEAEATAGLSYTYSFGSPTQPVSTTVTRDRDPTTGRESLSYAYSDGSGRVRLNKVPAESPYGFVSSGFVDLTSRGAKAAVYGTFASNRLGMEEPPAGTPVNQTFFDGLDRSIETLSAPTQGAVSVRALTRYLPLEQHDLDQRDTFENPTSSLPTVTRFDGAGRVRSVTKQNDFAGTSTPARTILPVNWRLDYDAAGRMIAFADSGAVQGRHPSRTFDYDTLGRLRRVVERGLGTVSFSYDATGNRTLREDETGTETSVYGSFGRALARTYHAKDGAVADYSHYYFYDTPDPNGPLAGVGTFGIGKLAWVQYPVGRRDFGYNKNGAVATVVDRLWDGVSAPTVRNEFRKTIDYDALGDQTAVHLPGDFHARFTRNARGSVEGIYAKFGTATETAVWSGIKYDVGGHAKQAASGNGTTSCWRRDSEGLLTGVLVGKTAEAGWSCADLDETNYDSVRGRGLVHLRYFRAYDDLVTQVMDLGRATKLPKDRDWEVGAPDRSATYTYDRMHELIGASTSIGTYGYRYDDTQNLIETTEATLATSGTRTTKYTHGDANTVVGSGTRAASPNAVTSVCTDNSPCTGPACCTDPNSTSRAKLFYDTSGRLLSYRGYDLKYDPQGRLVTAAKADGGRVSFYYDHEGALKISVSQSPEGAIRVDRNIFEEYEERNGDKLWSLSGPAGRAEVSQMAGLWVDNYLLDSLNAYVTALEAPATKLLPPRPVPIEYADLDNDGNNNFDQGDVAVALIANRRPTNKRAGVAKTVWRYYVQDAVQSSTHVIDSSGELVGLAHYAPYGATQTQWGLEPSWGFAGTRWPDLRETGLIPHGARVYAPELGRWISPDRHIGESPGATATQHLDTNLYGYSRNNPTTYHDPDGNEPVTLTVIAGAWVLKAAGEGAVDTVMDYALAKLAGEEFGALDAAKSFGGSMGMALVGAGALAHGKKIFKLAQLIAKNGDKAKGLIGPLRKLLSVAEKKLGPGAAQLRKSLDDVAAKMKPKSGVGRPRELKPLVIGESMEKRVNPFAAQIGGETYKGLPGFKPGMEAEGLAHNRAAIEKAIAEGRPIVDIGPDFAKRAVNGRASEAYEMERRMTKSYPGYQKSFERSGQTSKVVGQ